MADAHDLPVDRTLEGERVRLEPLGPRHIVPLAEVGLDPVIWKWMPQRASDLAGIERFVEAALKDRDRGAALPFATVDLRSGAVVGTTRFGAIAHSDLRAEIGWTWLAPVAWRTGINVEAKRLMLAFAFEELGLRRVEFKTDANNARSRTAIEALGAAFEGLHRKHMRREDGSARDSAYYSIIDDEWPRVRDHLDARLTRFA